MSQDYPSVGRIVHYVSYGTPRGDYTSECRAAVITAIHPIEEVAVPFVDLCVLSPEGMFFNRGVPYSTYLKGGSWHWPERV